MIPLITQVTSEPDNAARAIKELSAAVSVSRSSYYRHRRKRTRTRAVPAAEKRRRDTIETIALEMPNYGHRFMTAELQRRRVLVEIAFCVICGKPTCFVAGAEPLLRRLIPTMAYRCLLI